MKNERVAKLRQVLREEKLDALIVSSLHHIRYLTSFSGSNALCIVSRHEATFLTDVRYAEQSSDEVKGFKRAATAFGLYEGIGKQHLLRGYRRVGFESHYVSYAQYRTLKRLHLSISFVPTTNIVERLTLVKQPEEITAIKKAVAISDKVFGEILPSIRSGVRELEIAGEISRLHKRFGAERDAFETIVASGARGSLPHARASSKRIKNGEMVTLDFGCTVQGYNSDITRTIAVGRASRRAKEIYQIVLDAQCGAIDEARGGMPVKDLDAVARNSIRRAGYGKYFIHSLGHGLGLQLHEHPRVSALSKETLMAGSVITIEPGVYVPGFGGVRIEDDVLLTETGCRVLNSAPKELLIV
jgi:Xaa-Pro aminopeptidase